MYPFKAVVISQNEILLPQILRELASADVELDGVYPSVAAVIERVNLRHDETRLFVVHLDAVDDLAPLKHLSGVFAGRPILGIIGGKPAADELLRAMRQGVTQAVLLPFSPDDFQLALCSIETQFGHKTGQSRLIAVTGSHGGAGVTTLAVNLAYETAQQFQLDCILLELSQNVGVVAAHLDIVPDYTNCDLLQMGKDLDIYALRRALVPFGDRLSVLAGPQHANSRAPYNPADMTRLIQCARQLADVVLLDVPCTMDSMQVEILEGADTVVLVAEQTIPSIRMTLESLGLGMETHDPLIVVNRFNAKLEGFGIDHLVQALGTDHVRTICDDHESVQAAVNSGRPIRLTTPHSKVLVDIHRLTEELLGMRTSRAQAGAHHGFFGRIAHVLGVE